MTALIESYCLFNGHTVVAFKMDDNRGLVKQTLNVAE